MEGRGYSTQLRHSAQLDNHTRLREAAAAIMHAIATSAPGAGRGESGSSGYDQSIRRITERSSPSQTIGIFNVDVPTSPSNSYASWRTW